MIPITLLWLLLMLECLVCPAQLMFGLQVCTRELLCFLCQILPLEAVLMKCLQPLLGFMKLDQQRDTCTKQRLQIKKGMEVKCDYQETWEKVWAETMYRRNAE